MRPPRTPPPPPRPHRPTEGRIVALGGAYEFLDALDEEPEPREWDYEA
mgnify:CR=1 FL=1